MTDSPRGSLVRELAREALQAERLNDELRRRRPARIITFALHGTSYLQFVEDLAIAWGQAFPSDILSFAHSEGTEAYMRRHQPVLYESSVHLPRRMLRWGLLRESDLCVTASCFDRRLAPPMVYISHGQPSKRQSFSYAGLLALDAIFLLGPLQRQALMEFLDDEGLQLPPGLRLVPTGYGKSDAVLSGHYDAVAALREWGLDPLRPTVLYAPAFNEGASLREFGPELVAGLLDDGACNVIAKLPEDVFEPNAPLAYTGGRDWRRLFLEMETRYPRFRLVRDYRVDRALAAADVLITCVSSVSFEMLSLGKPVVFVETPKFFEDYLRPLFPGSYRPEWAQRVTVNGGKCFGTVVEDYRHLPALVRQIVQAPGRYVRPVGELRQQLLYNPGCAIPEMLKAFDVLLGEGLRGGRPSPARVFVDQLQAGIRSLCR